MCICTVRKATGRSLANRIAKVVKALVPTLDLSALHRHAARRRASMTLKRGPVEGVPSMKGFRVCVQNYMAAVDYKGKATAVDPICEHWIITCRSPRTRTTQPSKSRRPATSRADEFHSPALKFILDGLRPNTINILVDGSGWTTTVFFSDWS